MSDAVDNIAVENITGQKTIIIVCHAWFYEQIGGSFKIATEQAIEFVKQGYRVCYVCSTRLEEANANQRHRYIEQGVEICAYEAPKSKSPSVSNIYAHIKRTRTIVQEICSSSDVLAIIGHSPLQFCGAYKPAIRNKIHSAYAVHSPFDEELKSHWTNSKPSLIRKAAVWVAHQIEKKNLKMTTVIQTDSEFTRNHLIKSFGNWVASKSKVASGYVDCERFQPVEDKTAGRSKSNLKWEPAVPTFFTIRRLEPRMGIDTLVKAAGLLKAKNHSFRMLIAGAGSQLEELEEITRELSLEDNIHFPGRLSDEDVAESFALADCFVLPTKSLECFGLIILEAFACDTPVIATTAGAIPELANQQGEGWVIPPDNPEILAERMSAFLEGSLAKSKDLRGIALNYERKLALKRLADAHLPE